MTEPKEPKWLALWNELTGEAAKKKGAKKND